MKTTSSNAIELSPLVEASSDAVSKSRTRSVREQQLRSRHLTMLVLGMVVLAMSFLLSVHGAGAEGYVTWGGFELPPMCGSRFWFGVECPGCGLTRSFIAIAQGSLSRSWEFHRVGWLLWIAVVLQIPYRLFSLREMRSGVVERHWPTWFGNILIVALIGNWILEILSV